MKKLLCFLLMAAMLISMFGCESDISVSEEDSQISTPPEKPKIFMQSNEGAAFLEPLDTNYGDSGGFREEERYGHVISEIWGYKTGDMLYKGSFYPTNDDRHQLEYKLPKVDGRTKSLCIYINADTNRVEGCIISDPTYLEGYPVSTTEADEHSAKKAAENFIQTYYSDCINLDEYVSEYEGADAAGYHFRFRKSINGIVVNDLSLYVDYFGNIFYMDWRHKDHVAHKLPDYTIEEYGEYCIEWIENAHKEVGHEKDTNFKFIKFATPPEAAYSYEHDTYFVSLWIYYSYTDEDGEEAKGSLVLGIPFAKRSDSTLYSKAG